MTETPTTYLTIAHIIFIILVSFVRQVDARCIKFQFASKYTPLFSVSSTAKITGNYTEEGRNKLIFFRRIIRGMKVTWVFRFNFLWKIKYKNHTVTDSESFLNYYICICQVFHMMWYNKVRLYFNLGKCDYLKFWWIVI